ncbi:MAG TPA: matrixin family metalloprotease [Chthoniobacterales bacterium]|nr:matrixin family metalloprotease [Chthoniobacterales bacterium]
MNRSQPSVPPPHFTKGLPSLLISRLLGGACLLAALAATPGANGYDLEGPRWRSGTVTFVLSLGSPGRGLSDGSTSWNQPASAAFSIWNQYMGNLQINPVSNDAAPVSQRDGVNSVAFASSFFGSSFGSNTLAITGYSYSGGSMTEANVLVNNRISWDSYRGALRFSGGWDLRRVLIHEFGHALGLDHPDQAGQRVSAVMNSIISNIDTAVTDDINGIQALYGVNSGGSTPTPTPTPAATPVPTPVPTATPAVRSATITASPTRLRVGQTSTLTVRLSSASDTPITVNYFASGTGRNRRVRASFYSLSGTPGQVTIPAGQTSGTFTLTATSGTRRPRTVSVYLNPGSGYSVGYASRGVSITVSR